MLNAQNPGVPLSYRLNVASRAVLAIGGGYVLSALVAASLGAALPLPRIQAALAATLLAFVVHACFAIWVFCVGSTARAWLGWLVLVLAPALHVWWLRAAS
ncbi:iron transporter [Pusillimonas sp. TS35]|uniref:iron transporter n=1 Tax=Paracandidimonas lactea TaxID=2895524 RepID=UPI00136C479E|nr:iron transporter [Paracandidimonas lactea]MYN14846.1 iron transporter [Pusillimonas sp. TS35]